METKFKKECIRRNLTAREVSAKTGIPKRTIHSYFDGSRYPSRTNLKTLREKLQIDTAELFDE